MPVVQSPPVAQPLFSREAQPLFSHGVQPLFSSESCPSLLAGVLLPKIHPLQQERTITYKSLKQNLWCENKMVQSLWKTSQQLLQRLNAGPPCDPQGHPVTAAPLPYMRPWTNLHTNVHRTKKWKQPESPSTAEQMRKPWPVPTVGCYSAIKRNEVLRHTTTRARQHTKWRRLVPRHRMLRASIDMKCPEQANL